MLQVQELSATSSEVTLRVRVLIRLLKVNIYQLFNKDDKNKFRTNTVNKITQQHTGIALEETKETQQIKTSQLISK